MENPTEHHPTKILKAALTVLDEPLEVRQTALAGALLNDRYEIQGELGRGGIGVVYLAHDKRVKDRPVVVKVLLDEAETSAQGAWFRRHFEQEIEALARIHHPGVVNVIDTGVLPDGKPFFVMQYVKGVSLRTALQAGGRLTLPQCGALVRQIGQALNAAHEQNVIHRDLKPDNVMIHAENAREERIILIDFGIASVGANDNLSGVPSVVNDTGKTEVVGSLPYMAPEQLEGKPTTASDIWALAVIAYEALTGQLPFPGRLPIELFQQQKLGQFIWPQQLRPDLPAAAAQLLQQALSFDQRERPPSIRAFSEAFEAALRASPADATHSQPTLVEPAPVAAEPLPALPARVAPRFGKSIWLPGAALLGALILVLFYALKPVAPEAPKAIQPALPARVLSYSLSVLNANNLTSKPTELAGEVLFSGELFLRLNLVSEKGGYLYLVDEGPNLVRNLPHYIFLFPEPARGAAPLAARQKLYLPSPAIEQGFKVDMVAGTEKLWLIWSAKPLPLLERLRAWYNKNPKFPGEIGDPQEVLEFQKFLNDNATPSKPAAEKDETQTQLKLLPEATLLIHLIKLAHV